MLQLNDFYTGLTLFIVCGPLIAKEPAERRHEAGEAAAL